ncbi:MAG: hypothetical protein EAZ08_13220 [Cytophagales bacterium]|nr:MAG: hypothetical protein EAZ08_13220 [Cytophagales bacterium]
MKTYLFILLCLFAFAGAGRAQSERNKDVLYFKGSSKTVKGIILSRDSTHVKMETEWGDILSYQLKDIEQIVERSTFSKDAKGDKQTQASIGFIEQENKKKSMQAAQSNGYSILGNLNIGWSLGGALPMGSFGDFFAFGVGSSLTVKQFYNNFGFHLSAGAYSFASKEAISIVQDIGNIDFDNPQEPKVTTEKILFQVVPITVGADYHYQLIDILRPYAGVEAGIYMIGDVFTKPLQGKSYVENKMGYAAKVGILLGNRTKFMIEGKYNRFAKGELSEAGSFATLNLGVLFQIGKK